MASLSDVLSSIYNASGTLKNGLAGGSTIDAANPLDAKRLGLGAGNGSPAVPWTMMPMSITPGSTNPAPGVAGVDGTVAPSGAVAGVPIPDLGSWVPRIAIIVLGFIFVAAGLALFKSPVVVNAVSSAADIAT